MDTDPPPKPPSPVAWRLLAPLVFVLAGVLFVTSMVSSGGTDLRAGRYDDLAGLATAEAHDLAGLRARTAALNVDVDRLSTDLGRVGTSAQQRKAEALQEPAGLRAVRGPGLSIALDDAPRSVRDAAGADASDLVVHQQDIQAVANALWVGGAEAMTIQGQRVVSTTGIKCVGNTVVLHGVPYSPPYRISAIGPVGSMLSSVDQSPYIKIYLSLVSKGLGWKVQPSDTLRLPGYEGTTDLSYARLATAETGESERSTTSR